MLLLLPPPSFLSVDWMLRGFFGQCVGRGSWGAPYRITHRTPSSLFLVDCSARSSALSSLLREFHPSHPNSPHERRISPEAKFERRIRGQVQQENRHLRQQENKAYVTARRELQRGERQSAALAYGLLQGKQHGGRRDGEQNSLAMARELLQVSEGQRRARMKLKGKRREGFRQAKQARRRY